MAFLTADTPGLLFMFMFSIVGLLSSRVGEREALRVGLLSSRVGERAGEGGGLGWLQQL